MSDARSSSLESVATPCLVLDRGRLAANLSRVAGIVAARGVKLRPHLKTAKSIDVARLAAPHPSDPVAVSTLLEAEYFAGHGYRDIYYAVSLSPGKFQRAAQLARGGVDLISSVDDLATAQQLSAFATAAGVSWRILVEIDCGDGRSGIPVESPALLPIARALGTHFAGVTSHGGQSYGARTKEALAAVANEEAGAVRRAAERLKAEGLPVVLACIGTSPTAITSNDLTGVTDIIAGVYMFGDLFQAGIDTCGLRDLALSVLTEVISRPAHRGSEFLVDAGAFALSKDLSTAALPPHLQAGYGWVCDPEGRLIPGLKVQRVWQEHGLVVSDKPLAAGAFPIGSRLRILPNHACPTAAAHNRYQVIDGPSRAIAAVWPRINGW